MVRLHGLVAAHAGLDDVGIDRALAEELDASELLGLLLEHADELAADALALQLRIGDALRLLQEARLGVDLDEVDAELALEDLLDLLRLVEAHAAVIDKHAGEVLADRLVQQHGADG